MKYVCYYRVSTQKQGKSGLGLDAQKEIVDNYLTRVNGKKIADYVEVMSGANQYRPKLDEAIDKCKLDEAILIVAKLDRLSRDLHFITTLQKERIKFVCADNPDANTLTINLLATVAQYERELISKRTKEGLAQAKKRGVKLGRHNPKIDKHFRKIECNRVRPRVYSQKLIDYTAKMKQLITPLRKLGMTQDQICKYLTDAKVPVYQSGATKWHRKTYCRMITRIDWNE